MAKSNIYAEQSYLDAKNNLEKILNGEDKFADISNLMKRESSPQYKCPLQKVGLKIIDNIEKMKSTLDDNALLTIDDLTITFETLDAFICKDRSATSIVDLLERLKTKIKTEEYNKFVAKISIFVGLCVILTSASLMTFCIATGSAGLMPLAMAGLACVAPIFAAVAIWFDENRFGEAYRETGGLSHYFFQSTTKESETASKTLSILQSCSQ